MNPMEKFDFIKEAALRFYELTLMPITLFDQDGNVLGNAGEGADHRIKIFHSNDFSRSDLPIKHRLINHWDILKLQGKAPETYLGCSLPLGDKSFILRVLLGPYASHIKDQTPQLNYRCENHLPDFYFLIRQLIKVSYQKSYRDLEEEPINLKIKKGLDYIKKHYAETISLDHIAGSLDMNKSYFSSLFRKETGKTYTEYLHKYRIDQSMEELKKEHYTLLDVALAVGYQSSDHYSRIFKRYMGISPGEFRRTKLPKS